MNIRTNKYLWIRLVAIIALAFISFGNFATTNSPQTVEAATLCVNVGGTGPCYATLAGAVAVASGGDTINIEAGTYTSSAQEFIDKDLTIVGAGAGSTILNLSFDTGGSGDARGWFLVDTGVNLNISNLTIDGNGQQVYQAFRHKGTGSFSNVAFRNIGYSTYLGVAVVAFGGNVNITSSTFNNIGRVGVLYFGSGITNSQFSGNTYTGKGSGDFLDYALDISAGANVTVTGNYISNNYGVASSDGSGSAGILVSTYFGGGTSATITNTTLDSNSNGIVAGFDTSDTSTVNVSNSCFINNGSGFDTSGATGLSLDAANNWWNTPAGPTVGGFNGVSADVPFTPFLTAAPAGCPSVIAGPANGDFPNIGMIQISVPQAQPAYADAGGEIIRLSDGNELWLPHDYDQNGFDTYVVTETQVIDGQTWVGIWLGAEQYGWVPLDNVTVINSPN